MQVGKCFEAKVDAGAALGILLDKHVLKKAKVDSLAAVKAEILADKEIQAIFKANESALRKEWRGIRDPASGGGPMKVEGKEVINMEMVRLAETGSEAESLATPPPLLTVRVRRSCRSSARTWASPARPTTRRARGASSRR